jgi:hypothetical protein
VRIILKFSKTQIKSENYETCQYLMISYTEVVVEMVVFCTFCLAYKPNISEEVSYS